MGVAELAIIAVVIILVSRQFRRGDAPALPSRGYAELRDEVAALRAELDQQRQQTEELAERVDFSERALAQLRQERLPPGAH